MFGHPVRLLLVIGVPALAAALALLLPSGSNQASAFIHGEVEYRAPYLHDARVLEIWPTESTGIKLPAHDRWAAVSLGEWESSLGNIMGRWDSRCPIVVNANAFPPVIGAQIGRRIKKEFKHDAVFISPMEVR